MKVLLCFFITLSTFAITAHVDNCNSLLRVRKKSNLNSKVVATLDCKSKPRVQVVGIDKEWIQILYKNDIRFVHKNYLTILPEYKVSSSVESNSTGIAKECKSWVNIRSGPGEKFPVLGGLHCHEEIKVIGKEKKWFQVEYQKKVGFIFEERLEVQ